MAETISLTGKPDDSEGGSDSGPRIDIPFILATIRSQIIPSILIVALTVAAAVVWTMLQTPKYIATATVQIDDEAGRVLGGEIDSAQAQSSTYDVDRFLNTQLDVVRSRALAEKVADRLGAAGDARFFAAMEIPDGMAPTDRRAAKRAATSLLRGTLTVSLPRQSRIALISNESADPEMSARIANAYAEEFIRANLQRKFDSSAYARNFLSDQLAEARVRLENSERELNGYARAAGITRLHTGGGETAAVTSVTTESLLQLNTAANQARAARIEAESRWRSISSGDPLSAREVSANGTVQGLLAQRAMVQAELEDERTRHLQDHPNVLRLEARAKTISAQIDRIVSGLKQGVRADYESARAAEGALNQQVSSLSDMAAGEQDRSVRFTVLEREADTNRALYDALLQRYNELTASAGVASSNISLVDPAIAPVAPSSPRLIINIAYGLFAGLILSGLLVLLRLQLDDKVRTPQDVQTKLGLKPLGLVTKSESGDVVQDLQDPKSFVSEAYSSLRGAIGFAAGQKLGMLLVTSMSPAEGKSTTCYALARGYAGERAANSGGRVLLIDADMRRPSGHTFFGLTLDRGLSGVLEGKYPLEDAVHHIDDSEGLDFLPAGPIPADPGESVTSNAMRELLVSVQDRYDMVIVDSPPVLGLADAPALSAQLPATLLVIEAGTNSPSVLRNSINRLRLAEGRIIGATLTKYDPSVSGAYTGGYDYYYYYRYGTRDKGRTNSPRWKQLLDRLMGRANA